jgi:hypothetical protein
MNVSTRNALTSAVERAFDGSWVVSRRCSFSCRPTRRTRRAGGVARRRPTFTFRWRKRVDVWSRPDGCSGRWRSSWCTDHTAGVSDAVMGPRPVRFPVDRRSGDWVVRARWCCSAPGVVGKRDVVGFVNALNRAVNMRPDRPVASPARARRTTRDSDRRTPRARPACLGVISPARCPLEPVE